MAAVASTTANDGEDFQPGELVRVFSLGIKAKHADGQEAETEIERALVEDFDVKEARRKLRLRQIEEYLENTKPHELMELDRKRKSLELALQNFCSTVQTNYPDDLSPKLSSWQDVTAVVQRMQSRLERNQEKGKFRRATKHLRTFCNTVNSHSTALKMLPTNNEYVQVFYGALATSIQASERYTKVMETLPQALIDINDAVSAIEKRLWLFDNDVMKSYAWRMYSQIFSFLEDVIRWYTKRSFQRLVSSFNEHLPEFFEDQVDEIRKSAELIHQEAHLRAQADAQMSRLYLEGVDEKIDRVMTELRERDQRSHDATEQRYERFCEMMNDMRRNELQETTALKAVLQDIWNKIGQGETGFAVAEILEGDARRQISSSGREARLLAAPDTATSSSTVSLTETTPKRVTRVLSKELTRDDILIFSAELESYFDREQVQMDQDFPAGFFHDSETVANIQSWATATESRVLYISSDENSSTEYPSCRAALQYAALAREAGLPVCSYFCRLSNDDPPKGRTRETIELVALTYALIRQLVELLPAKVLGYGMALDESTFSKLEGTMASFEHAFKILETLLAATGHPITIIVIDGISLLDDQTYRSSEKWLRRLVDLLLKQISRTEIGVVKILFSSGGASEPLFEALHSDQIFIRRPERRKKGRVSTGLQPLLL